MCIKLLLEAYRLHPDSPWPPRVLPDHTVRFARAVAHKIVEGGSFPSLEEALATGVDGIEPPRTGKRFKTASGAANPAPNPSFCKRGQSAPPTRRRTEAPVPGRAGQSMSLEVWKPVFDVAQTCTTRPSPFLISNDHSCMAVLKQRIQNMEILQVFVGVKSRTLHSPLGALPPTVTPIRLSVAAMKDGRYICCGKDA